MNLVLLTRLGLEHRYVIRAIAQAFPEALNAVVVAESPPRPLKERWTSYRRRYTWRQMGSRVAAKLYGRATHQDRRRDAALREHLFPAGEEDRYPPASLLRVVPSLNGPETYAVLDDLSPDILAVYGTAMVRPPLIGRARLAALNMHTGLSPRYRGSDTVFWPLHNREPEWIGTTIHQLDPGIDSGPTLATVRPVVGPTDDEHTLFAKCLVVGAEAYVQVIRAVASGTATPVAQELSAGREYRFVDRTIGAEMRVRRLLQGGLLRDYVADRGSHPSS